MHRTIVGTVLKFKSSPPIIYLSKYNAKYHAVWRLLKRAVPWSLILSVEPQVRNISASRYAGAPKHKTLSQRWCSHKEQLSSEVMKTCLCLLWRRLADNQTTNWLDGLFYVPARFPYALHSQTVLPPEDRGHSSFYHGEEWRTCAPKKY